MTLLADLALEQIQRAVGDGSDAPISQMILRKALEDGKTEHVAYNWTVLVETLIAAPKLRIMPQVYDIAVQVWGDVEQDRQNLPRCQYPGDGFWMEWIIEDLRVGVLFITEQNIITFTYHPVSNTWETHRVGWLDGEFGMTVEMNRPPDPFRPITREDIAGDPEQLRGMGTLLSVTQILLSMMENPRLVEKQPKVVDTALQRARVKRGARPLSDHAEVVIHVTRKEREAREVAEAAIKAGRKLHFVRMFHRVKGGRVERVREHWRGNASLGVKPKPERYRVTL